MQRLDSVITVFNYMQEETMHRAQAALRKGLKKLNRSMASSRSNHLLYLALFVVSIFFVVFFWAKIARILRIF